MTEVVAGLHSACAEEALVKVAKSPVSGRLVARILKLLSHLETASRSTEQQGRPVGVAAVVFPSRAAQVNDEGVVEHGAVALGNALEGLGHFGHQAHVVGVDLFAHLVGVSATWENGPVADGVQAEGLESEVAIERAQSVGALRAGCSWHR